MEQNLVLELSSYVHPDDVDEVLEQIKAIMAYHGQDEGVLIKLYVHEHSNKEMV